MRTNQLAAILALTLALPVGAQNVSTGASISGSPSSFVDDDWTVRVLRTGPTYDPVIHERAASVVMPTPGPWQPNLPGSFHWIGAAATGTIPDHPDVDGSGRHLFDYLFVRTLSFAAGGGTFTFRCAVDNTFLGIRVNGEAVGGSCNVFTFGGTQTLNLGAGTHRIQFHVGGDGTTDGLLVDATAAQRPMDPTAVPEPATVVLTATGLALLAGIARRKRNA